MWCEDSGAGARRASLVFLPRRRLLPLEYRDARAAVIGCSTEDEGPGRTKGPAEKTAAAAEIRPGASGPGGRLPAEARSAMAAHVGSAGQRPRAQQSLVA